MSKAMRIFDVSARDGLQNEPNAAKLTPEQKVFFIKLLVQSGLKHIEAGSFVKPDAVPSMVNSAEVAEALKPLQAQHPDVTFSYLVPNLKGLDRAHDAKAKEIAIFLAVSEQFSRANINQDVDASFAAIAPVVARAKQYGMRVRGYISTVYGYDDLPFSPSVVASRVAQLLHMGCYEVSLGDTTGIATPDKVEQLLAVCAAAGVPLNKLAMHFHDTHGHAIENVAKSWRLGIRSFDAAAGGLGGCPYANSPKGNLRLEDLVTWCAHERIRCDVHDRASLAHASKYMLGLLGKST